MTEKLWWACGVNPGSIHHMEVLPPMSVFAWFALVPSGYRLGNLMDTDISTVNFKVQLCSVRPRQSWVQHDHKAHIKLHQFLCILLWKKNGEEKHRLEKRQSSLAQGMKAGDIHTTCHHILKLLNVEISPLAQGVSKPQSSLCWENVLNDHQHIRPTSGTLTNTRMTPQGCLRALTSTICTAAHYCCSSSRSGTEASREPSGYRS